MCFDTHGNVGKKDFPTRTGFPINIYTQHHRESNPILTLHMLLLMCLFIYLKMYIDTQAFLKRERETALNGWSHTRYAPKYAKSICKGFSFR